MEKSAATIAIPVINITALGGRVNINHKFPFTEEEANTDGYVVSDSAADFIFKIEKLAEDITTLCDRITTFDTPANIERYRKELVEKIRLLGWYELDTANINLRIYLNDETEE